MLKPGKATEISLIEKVLSYLFFFFLFLFASILFVINLSTLGEQQFVSLGQSFLQGKTYFLETGPFWSDSVLWMDHYYWPQGPFPAVVLIPFIILAKFLGATMLQGYLQPFLVIAIYFLLYRLVRIQSYGKTDALFLAFLFCTGSSFLAVALVPWVWFFAQIVAIFFILLALNLYFSRIKNYFLIGLCLGAAVATRSNTIFAATLFVGTIFLSKRLPRQKLASLFLLLAPIALALGTVAFYNYIRFGDIVNFGHSLGPVGDWFAKERQLGIYSLAHVPKNLYFFLIAPPIVSWDPFVIKANPWGMGILFTSPYLFYLLKNRPAKTTLNILLALTTLATIVPLMFFFSSGAKQYGYRYLLDFFPFLFLLFTASYKQRHTSVSIFLKAFILLFSLISLYFFTTLY